MQPKTILTISIFAILVTVGSLVYSQLKLSNNNQPGAGQQLRQNSKSNQQVGQPNRGNCLADECLAVSDLQYPAGELTSAAKVALDKAIADEYKALSVYQAVIAKFGSNRPFSMIKGAEEQHIAQLKAIYDKYDLSLPTTAVVNKVAAPTTLQQACQIGVDAEIANAALYKNELLPAVAEYEDITTVFTNLMNASTDKHLVAFERCN